VACDRWTSSFLELSQSWPKRESGHGRPSKIDEPLTLARIIEDIVRSAYQRRALEGIVEKDDELERAMQRDRKWKLRLAVDFC